jgi:succinate dehydrogenase / fumarate reductase membrane anchor subunit
MMSYRSPLSRARGLGSAKAGVGHWWMQRLTSVALVPLMIWLVVALALLGRADYVAMLAWVANPVAAVLLVVLIPTLFYHSSLGVRGVVEDYVDTKWLEITIITAINFINILLAAASMFAVLKIAFGAAA